jgi:hypothetical protein
MGYVGMPSVIRVLKVRLLLAIEMTVVKGMELLLAW